MRHLIVGDSHIAALKLAWDQVAEQHAHTELSFAGARGRQLDSLYIDDTILTSTSPNARRMMQQLSGNPVPIDVRSFDKCWIVGSQIGARGLLELYVGYRCERHENLGEDSVQLISADAYDLSAAAQLHETAGERLAHEVRAVGIPVGLIPRPMPSHAVLLDDAWQALRDQHVQREIADYFRGELTRIGKRVGASTHPQPAATLDSSITTRVEFSRGSIGLLRDDPHDQADNFHMNSSYGHHVVTEHILATSDRN